MKALVISGYGINCEREMAEACKLAGFKTEIAHAHDLLNNVIQLKKTHFLLFPGGFSFGDELGAAKAFCNRILYASDIRDRLQAFVDDGKCILGVCNGFQLLVKLGLLPGNSDKVSLTHNQKRCFENRWVYHHITPSPCIFTKNLHKLYLPIRHAEGRCITNSNSFHIPMKYATKNGNETSQYPDNPNGSMNNIAGICDQTGRILGMMAHPEAALYFYNHPDWIKIKEKKKRMGEPLPKYGDGIKLFQNVMSYLNEN